MPDKVLQKIFDDSEKAEFLENIQEVLPEARRAVVCFECPHKSGEETTEFLYYQLGFKMSYEVLGFLSWLSTMIEASDLRDNE